MKISQSFQPSLFRLLMLSLCIPLLWMCKKDVSPDNPSLLGEVYTVVDQPPTPHGGQVGLADYLMKNLRYPAEAQRARIQGKVVVGFIVTSVGHLAEATVNQALGGDAMRKPFVSSKQCRIGHRVS